LLFLSCRKARRRVGEAISGLDIWERLLLTRNVDVNPIQTVGDSSPMVGVACSRNSGLCNACRSKRLASTSLDAGISVGVHGVDADTPSTAMGLTPIWPSARSLKHAETHAHHAHI
ncbi:hypothetical protein Taro_008698, partial [Colocasia esculenta]|nr:hypothetical protein [Colocasia esculenta]